MYNLVNQAQLYTTALLCVVTTSGPIVKPSIACWAARVSRCEDRCGCLLGWLDECVSWSDNRRVCQKLVRPGAIQNLSGYDTVETCFPSPSISILGWSQKLRIHKGGTASMPVLLFTHTHRPAPHIQPTQGSRLQAQQLLSHLCGGQQLSYCMTTVLQQMTCTTLLLPRMWLVDDTMLSKWLCTVHIAMQPTECPVLNRKAKHSATCQQGMCACIHAYNMQVCGM